MGVGTAHGRRMGGWEESSERRGWRETGGALVPGPSKRRCVGVSQRHGPLRLEGGPHVYPTVPPLLSFIF